ncbi:hypothetical protein Emed_001415 [Eimeria media]
MSDYDNTVQSEPPTGFTETPREPRSVGGDEGCLTDEAQLAEDDMGPEHHPDGDRDAQAFEAYDDAPLSTCQPTEAPIKPVTQLSEALWLAQEELAEEQRLRAEERRQFAIVQDEASAAACRSLAAEAIADKEYVVRILGKAHQEWAISHSMKTRESQRGALLKDSAPPLPPEQRRSGVQKHPPTSRLEGTQSEEAPSLSGTVPALEAPGKDGAPAEELRVNLISAESRREGASKVTPVVSADAAGSAGSADTREACQQPQGSTGSSKHADATVNAGTPYSAVSDGRTNITDSYSAFCGSQPESKSSDLSPLPSAQPRPQSVTQCKPKLPDAATSLPSKITRQAVPPLPLGRGSSHRSGVPSARDLSSVNSLNCFLPRADRGGEAPAVVRKPSVRKARISKESGISHREAQHHTSRPASVRSVSRSGTKEIKSNLLHAGGPSMHAGPGADVRVTPSVSAAAALRSGSLPSRKTCGASLSSGSGEITKRAAVRTVLRDTEDDAFARKALRQVSAETPKGSSPPCPVSSSSINIPQQLKKKLPPLPPSLRTPSFSHEDGSYQHLERPTATVSSQISQEESCKARGSPAESSTTRIESGAAAVSTPLGTLQTEQITNNYASQHTIYKAVDAPGTRGMMHQEKSSTVLRSSVPPHLQDVRQQDFSLPCMPIKPIVPSESVSWEGSQLPFLTKVRGGVSNEGGENLQRQVAKPLAAAGARLQESEVSRQHGTCEPTMPRNASGPSGGAAVSGPAASHKQLPTGTTLRAPGEWPLKLSFAAPQRASLPAAYCKGVGLVAQPPAQQQRAYAPAGGVDSLLRPAAAVVQRQTVLPTPSSSAGLQQQYLMQQHQLRQQQLIYQAQHARHAYHLQQQRGVGGLQFFMNNGTPTFVARQQAPPWSPVYSGAMGR